MTRKPYTSLIRSENISFNLIIDHIDYLYQFTDKYLDEAVAKGRSPYLFTQAAYGKHLIIMAESDSTRASLNEALQSLIDGQALDQTDQDVLAGSKVLLYLRGGKKESLIGKAEGTTEIKSLLDNMNEEWKSTDHQYDFPLYYLVTSLKNSEVLKYYYSFDFLLRNDI